jgi:hypothetical protein
VVLELLVKDLPVAMERLLGRVKVLVVVAGLVLLEVLVVPFLAAMAAMV